MSAVHGIVDVDLDLQHFVAVKAAGDEGLALFLKNTPQLAAGMVRKPS